MSARPTKKVMFFIDASNTLRSLYETFDLNNLDESNPPEIAVEMISEIVEHTYSTSWSIFYMDVIRKYWFGSCSGGTEKDNEYKSTLRKYHFEPVIFHKSKQKEKEKQVDIALTRRILQHGYQKDFDIAVILAGDTDYLGVIDDIKRLGLNVFGTFFERGLSDEMKNSFEHFLKLEDICKSVKIIRKLTLLRAVNSQSKNKKEASNN